LKLPISEIVVNERFRIEYGDLAELKDSISKVGLIAPVLVDTSSGKPVLVAGMRRLLAHQQLGLTEIEVVTRELSSDLQRSELEYEENKRRKDFTWTEEVRAKATIVELRRSGGLSTNVSVLSEDLDESLGKISEDLNLARGLSEYPELATEPTRDGAIKRLKRLEEQKWRDALASVMPKSNTDRLTLHFGDCREALANMESESIHLLLTDPPWGVSNDESVAAQESKLKTFDDSQATAFKLLADVLPDLWRVLHPDAHAYFFYATKFHSQIFSLLSHRFDVNPIPLIWVKPGGFNLSPLARFTPNYETIFVCKKGSRGLERPSLSVFQYSSPSDKLHPNQKPVELLQELIEISSREGEVVLDPFAGSGATGVAALQAGRKVVLCECEKVYQDAIKIATGNALKEAT
jgi:ParB/RepB/Spo0J family partition protein